MGSGSSGLEPDAMEVPSPGTTGPGNIRELKGGENVLERAVVLTDTDRINAGAAPRFREAPGTPPGPPGGFPDDGPLGEAHTAELERELIRKALERTVATKTQAAEVLDLSPRALRYKIKDNGLE